jgi:NAD(P)-dependent dehydrogenase (short-subunit alcohol dehydrogenase family)
VSFDLSGRVALVTGAGQNVGEGIARALARHGAAVAVNDFHEERARRVAERLAAEGAKAAAVAFDVTDAASVAAGVTRVQRELGPLDILVNNAGNAGTHVFPPKRFAEMEPSEWAKFLDVNLYGVLHCTRAVIGGMCERGFGRVITISSSAGIVGIPMGISLYGAGKGGALAFMRHLAMEVARRGVTANSVALGLMASAADADVTRAMAATVPIGRCGTPEDAAAAVVWLASPEAAWVTGQTIQVNGGSVTS